MCLCGSVDAMSSWKSSRFVSVLHWNTLHCEFSASLVCLLDFTCSILPVRFGISSVFEVPCTSCLFDLGYPLCLKLLLLTFQFIFWKPPLSRRSITVVASFLLELLVVRVLSCPRIGNFFLDDRSGVYGQAPERRIQLALQDFSREHGEAYVGHSVGIYSWGQSSQQVLQTDGGLLERSPSLTVFYFSRFIRTSRTARRSCIWSTDEDLKTLRLERSPIHNYDV